PFSGKDKPVIDFLSQQESVGKMLQDLAAFFYYWIPRFEEENRSYLSIALGCTGGHHRSVYLAEQLAAKLKELDKQVIIRHRDV
ncbi:MAG: RNase adapter RapZ, partial [Gammaproteobacteria bacterium]